MINPTPRAPLTGTARTERAAELVLRLSDAENALQALTSGEIDAVIDQEGNAYLLRSAQEDLQQNQTRLEAIIDSLGDAIIVVNRGGIMCYANESALRVLGLDLEKLLGNRFFELIHDDDHALAYAAYFHVIEGLEPSATTFFRVRWRDGKYRQMEVKVGRPRNAFGQSVVLSIRLGPLEGRLLPIPLSATTAPDAPGHERFLAMLAHELRTPLGPVLLGLGELQEDERFLEARPTLSMIRRNVELQARLLEELLDFTTLGQQKLRLRPNLVDVHEAIRQVLEICAGQIKAARIDVRLQFGATENTVLADSMRLQQVLWYLLTNAIKFSSAGGAVIIATASEPDGHIAIDFIDLGIGIEPQLLPLIFEPFKQGDHHRGGLGLGLFIAKGIAEAQCGTLTVASGGHNRGTTFRLKFRAVSPLQPHLPEQGTRYEQ